MKLDFAVVLAVIFSLEVPIEDLRPHAQRPPRFTTEKHAPLQGHETAISIIFRSSHSRFPFLKKGPDRIPRAEGGGPEIQPAQPSSRSRLFSADNLVFEIGLEGPKIDPNEASNLRGWQNTAGYHAIGRLWADPQELRGFGDCDPAPVGQHGYFLQGSPSFAIPYFPASSSSRWR